jgi:hypothetical protein
LPKEKQAVPKTNETVSQSKPNSKGIFSSETTDNDNEVDNTGLKKSRGRRQLRNPSPNVEQEREDEQNDISDGSGLEVSYRMLAVIGDRRGKPKSDFDKHGNRRQHKADPKIAASHKEKQEKSTVNSNVRPAKLKTSNDFGGNTFWNRPANPKRKPPSNPDAFATASAPPQTHDLIVDTGFSHVLLQHKHVDLLSNVQWTNPHKNPYAASRAANGQILNAVGKALFMLNPSLSSYMFSGMTTSCTTSLRLIPSQIADVRPYLQPTILTCTTTRLLFSVAKDTARSCGIYLN